MNPVAASTRFLLALPGNDIQVLKHIDYRKETVCANLTARVQFFSPPLATAPLPGHSYFQCFMAGTDRQ